jgi:hypothetical protein
VIKIRIEASYKPSFNELRDRRFLSQNIKIPAKVNEIISEIGVEVIE